MHSHTRNTESISMAFPAILKAPGDSAPWDTACPGRSEPAGTESTPTVGTSKPHDLDHLGRASLCLPQVNNWITYLRGPPAWMAPLKSQEEKEDWPLTGAVSVHSYEGAGDWWVLVWRQVRYDWKATVVTQARSWAGWLKDTQRTWEEEREKIRGAQSSFPHEIVHRLGSQIIKSKDWNEDGEIKEASRTGAVMCTIQLLKQNCLRTWIQNTGPALRIFCDLTLSAISVHLPLFVVKMVLHTSCYLLRAYYFPVIEVMTFLLSKISSEKCYEETGILKKSNNMLSIVKNEAKVKCKFRTLDSKILTQCLYCDFV